MLWSAERTRYVGNLFTPWANDLYDRFPLLSSRSFRADIFPDLYDLAHFDGLELYNLHDLALVSGTGSVLCRSCTTPHNGKLGSRLSTADHDFFRFPKDEKLQFSQLRSLLFFFFYFYEKRCLSYEEGLSHAHLPTGTRNGSTAPRGA